MQTARIEKRIGVRASSHAIWEIIADLPGWSRWNAYERDLEGRIGFGSTLQLTEALPDRAERRATVRVGEWQPQAQLVWFEKRGMFFNVTRYFEIEELAPESCIVANGAIYSGLRGELFHDRHRAAIRAAYEDIAEGLKRTAEG